MHIEYMPYCLSTDIKMNGVPPWEIHVTKGQCCYRNDIAPMSYDIIKHCTTCLSDEQYSESVFVDQMCAHTVGKEGFVGV